MRYEVLGREHLDLCADALTKSDKNQAWTFDRARMRLNHLIGSFGFLGYVAYENDLFVGALFAHEVIGAHNTRIAIDEFIILPEFQNRELGSDLLDVLRLYIRRNNFSGIYVLAEKRNPSVNFFKKNGFIYDEDYAIFSGT